MFNDPTNSVWNQNTSGVSPAVSLTAVSATGPGTVLDGVVSRLNASMQVLAAGSPTAGSVQLQGSLDGVSWFNLGSAVTTSAAGVSQVTVTNALTRFARANVATAISGGTVTVFVSLNG
jgi:hypothetical protein